MKIWIVVLKVFGCIWLVLAFLLIIAGTIGVWMKEGFWEAIYLFSPFNWRNMILTVITIAPGIAAISFADRLKRKLSRAQ